MRYKFEDIEGIGRAYGSKLSKAGFNATDDLLKHCGSTKGRRQVAAASGLDEGQLLKWANMADLMRIRGIGKQFSELLEAAGVDTVKELRTRRADNLATKMKEANAAKKLTRSTPSERQVAGWIDQAKSMAPMISH
jgi:predicted flap endonuclease-1-like 5' DNA nuclease